MSAGRENELEHLAAEARYHRERYDLYRARMYSGRPTTDSRLRELKLSCETAEARLQAARHNRRGPDTDEA